MLCNDFVLLLNLTHGSGGSKGFCVPLQSSKLLFKKSEQAPVPTRGYCFCGSIIVLCEGVGINDKYGVGLKMFVGGCVADRAPG